MKRTTFSLLFYIKRTKLNTKGEAPIYFKLTINGKSKEVSLKPSCKESLWDKLKSKVKGSSLNAKEINDYMDSIAYRIRSIQRDLEEKNIEVDIVSVMDVFNGKKARKKGLIELFDIHNDQQQKLVGTDCVQATVNKYITSRNHLNDFIKKEYDVSDVNIDEVNYEFLKSFELYLKHNCQCQHNSAMKHMKSLKKVVNMADSLGLLTHKPFANYKISIKKKERDYLTLEEINKIQSVELSIDRLDKVRDVFLFQCYTGLSYADIQELTIDSIETDINGDRWIKVHRKKTGQLSSIILLKEPLELIKKYEGTIEREVKGLLFPVSSNQKMNAYLKEIADLSGVNKRLTTHLGRHTFASTIVLGSGVSMEALSKMLGHGKITTTQIYGKVSDERIREEMFSKRKII